MFIYYPWSNIVRLRLYCVGDRNWETIISVLLSMSIKYEDVTKFPECATFDVLKDEVIGSFDRPVDVTTVDYRSDVNCHLMLHAIGKFVWNQNVFNIFASIN